VRLVSYLKRKRGSQLSTSTNMPFFTITMVTPLIIRRRPRKLDQLLDLTTALETHQYQCSLFLWQKVEACNCSEQRRQFRSCLEVLLFVEYFLMFCKRPILFFTSASTFAKGVLFSWGRSVYRYANTASLG